MKKRRKFWVDGRDDPGGYKAQARRKRRKAALDEHGLLWGLILLCVAGLLAPLGIKVLHDDLL